jgi:drug/metabolite transporter (DMT)-like permease
MTNILLALTVVFWGLSFIATKMALDYLTPIQIIALRLILGTPVLYMAALAKKSKMRFRNKDFFAITAASITLGIHFLIQAVGLKYTSATNTAWLIASIPVFIAVMSALFLKEKLSPLQISGIAVAAVGIFLLISKGRLNALLSLTAAGDWIILSSAITWGIYTILTKRLSGVHNPLPLSVGVLILPTLLLNLYAAATTPITTLLALPLKIVAAIIFLGIFCLGLAHWFWLEGLSRKTAAEVGAFIYLEPIITTIAAVPLLNEKLTIFSAIGAVLIIAGVYLAQTRN